VVAVVEKWRVREAVLAASNWRDRFLDLRTARIVTVGYYRGEVIKRVNQTSPDFVCSCYPSAQCGVPRHDNPLITAGVTPFTFLSSPDSASKVASCVLPQRRLSSVSPDGSASLRAHYFHGTGYLLVDSSLSFRPSVLRCDWAAYIPRQSGSQCTLHCAATRPRPRPRA
jgi:hypothetical protein